MKPLVVTSGEPAGIGPDLCLTLAGMDIPLVVMGDPLLLAERAQQLGLSLTFEVYDPQKELVMAPHQLTIIPNMCAKKTRAGQLDARNAAYVLDMIAAATMGCVSGDFSGMVTAPVHKAIINEAGFAFTGHTEFIADLTHTQDVVMMLACQAMNVALVTTHLALKDVPQAITIEKIINVVEVIHQSFCRYFKIQPNIAVAGLNPHAGEGGYLGDEEINIIEPALLALQHQGKQVFGPFPADTLFTQEHLERYDVFLAMYHDQGLSVLKYAGFGQAVNVTLGLPIVRTSVDHGTALPLAATGRADAGSLHAAVRQAWSMVQS